jgi:hypothetical protein
MSLVSEVLGVAEMYQLTPLKTVSFNIAALPQAFY